MPIKLSLNLPKSRLHLRLVRRRGPLFEEPILPKLEDIKNIKSGSKISRFFRHIFSHKSLKKILGANFALVILAASFIPTQVIAGTGKSDSVEILISSSQVQLATEKGTQYPLTLVKINQGFRSFHPGIDLGGKKGDTVRPIMAGVIESIENSRFAYGNSIIINHGNNLKSRYAHLNKIEVNTGQEVAKETKIGEVGSSGWSSGNHLHLEVIENGHPINPLTILPR